MILILEWEPVLEWNRDLQPVEAPGLEVLEFEGV